MTAGRWTREANMARRREMGIGPHARRDPELDLMTLARAAGFTNEHALGCQVGLSGSSLQDAKEKGLTIWAADRLAAMFEMHPFDVWGTRWYEAGVRHEAQDALRATA